MQISELLELVSNTTLALGLPETYIVGGMPRDKVLNRSSEVQDIDLTNGDDSISYLADELQKKIPGSSIKEFPDGHKQLNIDGIKIDFSSNFNSPQAKIILKSIGVNPSSMILELMSRDFTCNTLLMTLDFKNIKDVIGVGIRDINQRIIRTPLPPRFTLMNDPKRIIRVIYLATKLGFSVEPQIISFIKLNKKLFKEIKPQYISKKINESLIYDTNKTIQLINDMDIWEEIPITQELAPYYKKPANNNE